MDAVAGLLDGARAHGAFLLRSVMEPPWAILIEDSLGVVLSDEQIGSVSLADPEHLRALVTATSRPR